MSEKPPLSDGLVNEAAQLVRQMTIKEKASLTSGENFWQTKAIERLELPSITVADGPHGLRKPTGEAGSSDLSKSHPATCFPTASATACSFDRELLRDIGKALGQECRAEGVSVLLGPGINMKRSPLCGRNFEYFSEDPYLTGELATAMVDGVQSEGIGTSLKHFAGNNQETHRMTIESVIDERALREIYLSAFERVVKLAQPWTVMASYNKLQGRYLCENRHMLTDVLRDEWGFRGLIVSDWGACGDRVEGVRAGLDLEMPGIQRSDDDAVEAAVQDGSLQEKDLDACATRVTELVLKAQRGRAAKTEATGEEVEGGYDHAAHHLLARQAACESAVLLKNDDKTLPGDLTQNAAVIGTFAKEPRYQGSGSSLINPNELDCAYDEFKTAGLRFEYAPGYDPSTDRVDEKLIVEACEVARDKDIVYLFAGLTDSYESEGFDREDISMPANQVALIGRLAEVNPNLVVVLAAGSVVDVSWEDDAKAILMGYLSGEAGAGALVDLLLGKANPSGKLAESWPLKIEDNPSYHHFPGYQRTVEYRESIFIGYRYYDTAQLDVRYPFGYGLSYTTFEYSELKLSADAVTDLDELEVSVDVTNTGEVAGAEIVQLYVSNKAKNHIAAEQELKGFERVELEPGETTRVSFTLGKRAFAYYNASAQDWCVVTGEHGIRVASSSRHIRLDALVSVLGTKVRKPLDHSATSPSYYNLKGGVNVSEAEFTALYGKEMPPRERSADEPYDRNSTFSEIQDTWVGRRMVGMARRTIAKMSGDDENLRAATERAIMDAPLRTLLLAEDASTTPEQVEGMVTMLNGHFFKGLRKVL